MYEKQGYLKEQYKLFYLNDISDKTYDFHYHDFYKIVFFIRGDVIYNIEGKNYELSSYDIVFVNRNEIHRPVVSDKCEYERYVLYLSEDIFDDKRYKMCFDTALKKHCNVTKMSVPIYNRILELLNRISSVESYASGFEDLYSYLDVKMLLLILSDAISKNGMIYSGNIQFNSKIVEVCDYINNHLSDDLSVDRLSEMFFISKYYFMRQFKTYTGISLHQYVVEKRIQYVKTLVAQGNKVTFACIEAGFNDYSTYLRASKKRRLNSYNFTTVK